MTVEEVNKVFDGLRAQGADDNAIIGTLYAAYKDQKLSTDELSEFLDALGYEFTPEFAAMSEEDKHEKGWESTDEKAEGVTEEEVEDAKEVTPDEKSEGGEKSDGGEKVEEKKEEETTTTQTKEEEKEDKGNGESEEKEKEKAMNLFFGA